MGRGLSAKQRTRNPGEPGMGQEREQRRGKALVLCRGWTGPKTWGHAGARTPLGVWTGASAPPSPPTHQTLARLAVLPKPGAAQGAGPSLSLASPWLPSNPPPPPPEGTSHITGTKANSSSSSSESPAMPSPLLFSRQTFGEHKSDHVSSQLQTLFVSLLPSPHLLLLTSPGSPVLTLSKKNTCHGPSTVLDHSLASVDSPPPTQACSDRPGPWAPPCLCLCPAPLRHPTLQACGSLFCIPKPLIFPAQH